MRWPIVLIHGYPFDHSMWDSVAEELSGKARVIVPDLPGFGGEPVLKSAASMDRYADFIGELLDKENLSAAVVVGMSMGGYVALSFAENYPDRVVGLGLVATQAAADTEDARKARAAMIEKVRKEGPQAAAEAISPKLFAAKNAQNELLLKFPRDGAAKAGVEGICWALQAMAGRPDRTFVLRNLECPSAVVHGVEDKIIPRDRAQQMARETPGCEYIEIEGAGHGLPIEEPKIVADNLFSLLRRAESYLPHKNPRNRPPVTFAPSEKGL
ncbi:MAG: putative hydrolase [Verrucomicrobiales bacterium]|nr:putative hydrolase [Verrucomicrobiales bacterium]